MVNGSSGNLELYKNTAGTGLGDPADFADTELYTEALVYPSAGTPNVRISSASSFLNTTPDFFLDFSVPLSQLSSEGLEGVPLHLFVGTSNSAASIDVDLRLR